MYCYSISLYLFNKIDLCDICHFSKQKRLPFPVINNTSSKYFDLVHVDIWGPYYTLSIDGHNYCFTLVDDFSHFTWIILMKHKIETKKHISTFISFIHNQFFTSLKSLRTDNGNAFLMHDFFTSKGILN